ncbi:LCP family protein [Herbiconiux sp. KACC 21604]|uniref:LCP family protein n=1 Tax=unclassified Herbiconiux TaxID=2618217 RepID=UPI001491FA95|nr:LCP family protein [Herbiconiux sp. SALV-R1]QJU55348.1 LytR family transcriptional regulator [Herbiconiux sp. SALV-R1]WPO86518.1 LCP family protein [Herbiconiux sp. KACC 21604]
MSDTSRRHGRQKTGPTRHGRLHTPSPVGLVVKAVAVALAVALVSIGGVAAYAINGIAQQVNANAVDISGGGEQPPAPPVLGAFEGGFNFLIIGTDNDPNQGDTFGERDATLNDVNILLHVSADHKNAVVVSFPRDLMIAHPECTDPSTGEVFDAMSSQPLNEAFSRGGLACVNTTIESLTGLDINYAAATSFNGVIEMTNAIGGVPVCLVEPIFDSDSGLDLPAGTSVIEGQMALAFLRNRHGVGDGSDLSRIASQQQYLSSMVRTLKSANTLTDISKLYGLASAAAQNIQLSTSLTSLDSMVSLALTMKDVDLNNIVFVQYPTGADAYDPNKVVPVQDLADVLFAKLQADEPFTLAEGSTGTGSTVVDDGTTTPADPGTEAGTDTGTGTEAGTGDPAATDAPVEASPEVIDGLKGQTAAEQTCANAFSY